MAESLIPRGRRQVRMDIAVYHAKARDLARIIDPLGAHQIPTRVCRDEGVEIHPGIPLPDERVFVIWKCRAGSDRSGNDLALVVDGVAARRPAGDGPRENAEILHTCFPGP
jgi:hypothetical protein